LARREIARVRPAFAIVVMALLASCSREQTLYPVTGRVLFAGKPTPGATVVFHPLGSGDAKSATRTPMPTGEVQPDGSFTLKTHPHGDGAPPGEYQVAIVWLDNNRKGEDGTIFNRLPGRYANPQTSGLTARVNAGLTELQPFEMKR
jgi:hypothetical protein